MTGALVSVRPEHSRAIMKGEKTVELRRRAPDCSPGDVLVLYETSPTMAIVGFATVKSISRETPRALWATVSEAAAISRTEFSRYFAGRDLGAGIHLSGAQTLSRPISLAEARTIAPVFRPPQSWCYLASLPASLLASLRARGVQGHGNGQPK